MTGKKSPWLSTKSPLMWNGLVEGFEQKPHKFQSLIFRFSGFIS